MTGALERKFWDALCDRIGRPDFAALHDTGDPAADPPGDAPQPGEHTRDLLEEAGFSAAKIDALLTARAIA